MKKYSLYLAIILTLLAFAITICFVPISASKLIPNVEAQIEKDLGVKVHIEKLILRLGPLVKVKAPIMHIMYSDGQKFAQFDNVKFYIPWTSVLKEVPNISKIQAKKLTIRVNSNDEFLPELMKKLEQKNFSEVPNINLKEYSFKYTNKDNSDIYALQGQLLDISKIFKYRNYKLNTKGICSINNKNLITYDILLTPNIQLPRMLPNVNLSRIMTQLKELDFHSDIITDIKLYKNSDDLIQASGFINIDNISVLDPDKNNPKSFVYLTLLGDRGSVLSNIYTSPTKKVYIEGMINNSKKPVIDLKVKTDEIRLNDLYHKLRIITDFSGINDIRKVGGTINANFTLKGDLNKIKSNGFIKINDASIKSDGLQIEKINFEIDLSNNIINIVKAIGYVNNSPIILKGYIDKKIDLELIMDKVDLKYLCPTSFGVKSGVASLIANIGGTLDKITHRENLQIENLELHNSGSELALESLKINTNKNNTAYINNVFLKNPETEIIKIPSMKLNIDENNLSVPETNIFMPNSKLTVKSDIVNYNNNDITFNAYITGFINSKDIKKATSKAERYPVKLVLNGNKNVQNVSLQVLLENAAILDEPAIINFVSKLEKNQLKIEDLSVVNYLGRFSDDLKSNLKGAKKIFVNGIIENIKKPNLKNLRIFIPQLLNIKYLDTVFQLKGDLFVNGELNEPDIIGQISLQNMYSQPLQLSVSNAIIDFNKNIATLNAPLIKVADSTVSANANILTNISKGLTVKNLNLKSKYINTDTVLMYKDSPIIKAIPVVISEGKIYSEKIYANLYGEHLYLTAFYSDLSLVDDVISLKNISSELFNGKLSGAINYNLRDEHFDSKILARGVSAAPIFDIISSRKDTISGNMDFDANLKGELTSKQSLNGNIKFIVHNGRMSTLGKLEHLLYAQNVVADSMLRTSLSVVTKAITLKDTGLFKYLRGEILLQDGLANIKMLQSQGPLMSLFIKGIYNPMNDYAQLVVLGRLSDEIISGLGAFGDFSLNKLMIMLTGEENKYSVLPQDYEKIPLLPMKNTKEFRSLINGIIDKPSSVVLFNWISYSQKDLKQKEIPLTDTKLPSFIDELPY